VARALPFQWTLEEEMKFVPVIESVNDGPPAMAELGFKSEMTGPTIVNVIEPEVPPPGAGLETVTIAVPALATSAAVIAACKEVLETNVVVRALPFHWTVEDNKKFVPVTVSVNAAPGATAELGFKDAIVGTGLLMAKINALEVPPPGPGVETVTIAVPALAMSAAVIAACKVVLETKVAVRALPFHWTVEDDTKFVPVILSVKPAPPATVELGFKDAIVGVGFGFWPPALLLHPTVHPTAAMQNNITATQNTRRKTRVRLPFWALVRLRL